MLGKDYILINGTGYTPTDFEYELQSVEDVGESEAGTDLINVKRLDKHIFHTSWEGISSGMLDELEEICKVPVVLIQYRGEEYRCRARGIAPKLAKGSYRYKRSDGLWSVSITFTQI